MIGEHTAQRNGRKTAASEDRSSVLGEDEIVRGQGVVFIELHAVDRFDGVALAIDELAVAQLKLAEKQIAVRGYFFVGNEL